MEQIWTVNQGFDGFSLQSSILHPTIKRDLNKSDIDIEAYLVKDQLKAEKAEEEDLSLDLDAEKAALQLQRLKSMSRILTYVIYII